MSDVIPRVQPQEEPREQMPDWLLHYRPGDAFRREAFFSSRVVYCPGISDDGQPVKRLGSAHVAHCFVYACRSISAEGLRSQLQDNSPDRFRGYKLLAWDQVSERELFPDGWQPNLSQTETQACGEYPGAITSPFAILAVLEREATCDYRHGPKRLALLFLGADPIAVYDALWCQRDLASPYCVFVDDCWGHPSWSHFGCGGVLERLAARCEARPTCLLVAKSSEPWYGYSQGPEPRPLDGRRMFGGFYGAPPFFRRSGDNSCMRGVGPAELLQTCTEQMPEWLRDYRAGDIFPREAFFSSRIVYYPGARTDVQPVNLFRGAHAAHSFLYVDQSVSADTLRAHLRAESQGTFRGYRLIALEDLEEQQINPAGWSMHLPTWEVQACREFARSFAPFGMFAVWERKETSDDHRGPARFSVVFLGADGFATFDALWCQGEFAPPYCIVIQDHGFGGNGSCFGRGGVLENLSVLCQVRPEWLLVATSNSTAWDGYTQVSDPGPPDGGEHGFTRTLFRRSGLPLTA